MMEYQVKDSDDLYTVAKDLLKFAEHEKVFLFSGEMGAGKTTFIKSICKELGVADSVSSPTYSIVNEYDSPNGKIFHFDFYRIKYETEAFDLGFEEYLYSGNYCFIEWPENITNLCPEKYIKVTLEAINNAKRLITAQLIKN
jgi:tRNA threonylcarbamoyladenosine biosynthesis protein TsaE